MAASDPSEHEPGPRPLLAGNWKMNGLRRDGLDLARALARRAREAVPLACDIVVCPPATLLAEIRDALDGSPVMLGAQDCHGRPKGAHTGDVSAAMLADVGCRYAIVGHSERRAAHGETDAMVRAKAEAVRDEGIVAIICVGESAAEREAGTTLAKVGQQLEGSVPDGARVDDTAVAYEPVWAIGSGRTPSVSEIAEVHRHVHAICRERFSDAAAGLRVLYGGSVTADNAAAILGIAEVGGALVGGASLSAEGFWAICRAC